MAEEKKELTPQEKAKRQQKKTKGVKALAQNINKLRRKVRKDLKEGSDKDKLTALVVALMDKTAERVGNEQSAKEGHFGVTGLKCKHIEIKGGKVSLKYTGKSGVKHEKSFSDGALASALKECSDRCDSPEDPLFVTSKGFKIKADRVNRYLKSFDVTAKDMRGFAANRFMEQALNKSDKPKEEKDRKKKFLEVLDRVAERVGHTKSMLRNSYLLPGFEDEYVKKGKVLKIKNASASNVSFEVELDGRSPVRRAVDAGRIDEREIREDKSYGRCPVCHALVFDRERDRVFARAKWDICWT